MALALPAPNGSAKAAATFDEIQVDEIVYEDSDDNIHPDNFGAEVEMRAGDFDNDSRGRDELQIRIENNSAKLDGADADPSEKILTGIGFELDLGLKTDGSYAALEDGHELNWDKDDENNDGRVRASREWGFDGNAADDTQIDEESFSTINTTLSSHQPNVEKFKGDEKTLRSGTIDNTNGVNGPDFGIVNSEPSEFEVNTDMEGVADQLTLTMQLSRSVDGETLVDEIDRGDVVVGFGSPQLSNQSTPVPGPSGLMLLMGGIAAVATSARSSRDRQASTDVSAA
jgi:hypothetical protein